MSEPLTSTENRNTHGYPIATLEPHQRGVLFQSQLVTEDAPMLYTYYGTSFSSLFKQACFFFGGGPAPASSAFQAFSSAGRPVTLTDVRAFLENDMDAFEEDDAEYMDAIAESERCADASIQQFLTVVDQVLSGTSFEDTSKTVLIFSASKNEMRASYEKDHSLEHICSRIKPYLMAGAIDGDYDEEEDESGYNNPDGLPVREYSTVVLVFGDMTHIPISDLAGRFSSLKILLDNMFFGVLPPPLEYNWWTPLSHERHANYTNFVDYNIVASGIPSGFDLASSPCRISLGRFEAFILARLKKQGLTKGEIWSCGGRKKPAKNLSSVIGPDYWNSTGCMLPSAAALYQALLDRQVDSKQCLFLLSSLLDDCKIHHAVNSMNRSSNFNIRIAGIPPIFRHNINSLEWNTVAKGITMRYNAWDNPNIQHLNTEAISKFIKRNFARLADTSGYEGTYRSTSIARWPFYYYILSHSPSSSKKITGGIATTCQGLLQVLLDPVRLGTLVLNRKFINNLVECRRLWIEGDENYFECVGHTLNSSRFMHD